MTDLALISLIVLVVMGGCNTPTPKPSARSTMVECYGETSPLTQATRSICGTASQWKALEVERDASP